MYRQTLSQSHFPATDERKIESISIGAALARAAEDSPRTTALREVTIGGEIGRSWTYKELNDQARRLAGALLVRHEPGDRIAIFAHNVPEWVLMEYAAAIAGLTLVTVNPSFQPREVKYVVEQSRSRGIYCVENYRGNPIAKIARDVAAEVPAVAHVIDICDEEALYAGADAAPALPKSSPRDPVQIQYTSGTTGFPKGAVLHHEGLYNNGKLTLERLGVKAGDKYLNPMPLFHTAGCVLAVLGCLSRRATLYLAAMFDAPALIRIAEQERITALLGVPTMITGLVEAQDAAQRDLSSVRGIFSGGSMVAPELVKRAQTAFGAKFQIIYGQTETSPVLTAVWGDDSFEDATETIGQPLPHTEVSIRDPATNAIVPVGATGEICARGYMIMLEYNDNPEATKNAIDAEGWLHTGDLGTMDARGFVKITGRVKEMIIRGGENLFPAEIENAMLEHPEISEVAVVGLPDERFGEIVACFLRCKGAGEPLRREDLVRHCRSILSPQKTPSVWVMVEEWPLTGSGKIRKFLLREMYEAGKFEGRAL
ncbi:MAG: AMP-binding protein [Alphaproteobacteria bacterium]